MDAASKEDAITWLSRATDPSSWAATRSDADQDLGTMVAALEAKKTNPSDDKAVYLRADTRANFGKVKTLSTRSTYGRRKHAEPDDGPFRTPSNLVAP